LSKNPSVISRRKSAPGWSQRNSFAAESTDLPFFGSKSRERAKKHKKKKQTENFLTTELKAKQAIKATIKHEKKKVLRGGF